MRNSTHLVLLLIISSEEYGTHISRNSIVRSVGSVVSIHNIVYDRFSSLCTSAMFHPSSLVRTIFTDSSHACNPNFIGYNCLYGTTHCKSYACDHIAIGKFDRELNLAVWRSWLKLPNLKTAKYSGTTGSFSLCPPRTWV